MAKYYPDIAKGAKGNRFHPFYYIILYRVLSFLCKQKRDLSSSREDLLDVVSHRSFSHRFLLKNRFIHRRFVLRKQILPGRETNLRRGTFFILVSRFYQISRATRGFLCVRIIIIGREIETSKDFCSGASRSKKALMRKNEQNERFLTRALFLSLSTCDEHTHTHTT